MNKEETLLEEKKTNGNHNALTLKVTTATLFVVVAFSLFIGIVVGAMGMSVKYQKEIIDINNKYRLELEEKENEISSFQKEAAKIRMNKKIMIAEANYIIKQGKIIHKKNKELEIKKVAIAKVASRNSRREIMNTKFDVLTPSKLTAEDIDYLLKGTPMHGLGKVFVSCEKEYGINALFLMQKSAHESDYGRKCIGKGNIAGIKWDGKGAYVIARTAEYDKSGNKYYINAKFKAFNSKEQCVRYIAKSLKNNYLTPGGKYYKGTSIKDINKSYASDNDWSICISQGMASSSKKLLTKYEEGGKNERRR